MFNHSVPAPVERLISSPSWRILIRFLLLGSLLCLRFPHASAQTTITGAQIRNPLTPVAALPSTCKPYSVYYLTTNHTAYICTATDTFAPLAAGTGGDSGLPSPTGPGYLFTDGATVSWGNILTGGSGALDCTSTPGRCDVTSIVPLKHSSNIWTGANDFHSALLRIPESTIAGLPPAAANSGREFMVLDGASTCDTTTGGGSTRVLVQSTGTSYVAPNCSTGGGGGNGASSTSQLTDFAPSVSGGTLTIQPGLIRFGTMTCTNFTSTATASISSISGGTGIAKLYVSSTCALVLQYPNNLAVTWRLDAMAAQPVMTPMVPNDAWYVADVNIGPSTVTSVADKRSPSGVDAMKAGNGIIEDCTLGPCLISTDPAVVPTLGGVNAYTGIQDNTSATITKPSRTVSSDPSGACPANNEVVLSTASGNLFSCFSGTWHAASGGGGGGGGETVTLATGGGDFLFGTPSYSPSGIVVAPTGMGHSGSVWAFINKFQTSTAINYEVTTAAVSGSFGLLFGFYTADLSKPLCVSAVATGTKVSTTGAQSVGWASGPNVSAGTCTIPIGAATALVITSDSGTLALRAYGDPYHFSMMTLNSARRAGYAGSNDLSTGTAEGLAFGNPAAVTFSPMPPTNYCQPVIYIEN